MPQQSRYKQAEQTTNNILHRQCNASKDYKITSVCYDVVSDTAPLYLSDLLCLYVPSRSLRSSADTRIFWIPTRKKKFQG